RVVVNHEEQYSIWPEYKDNPLGWRDAGKSGPKSECLAYIKEVWTDMRPLSLRKRMEEMAREPLPPPPLQDAENENRPDPLVQRLSTGRHPVVVSIRPRKTIQALKERIDMGYVHIKFTETETELGVRLDQEATDLSHADFGAGTGKAHIAG